MVSQRERTVNTKASVRNPKANGLSWRHFGKRGMETKRKAATNGENDGCRGKIPQRGG